MNFHHLAYWQDKALSLAIENRLFINGVALQVAFHFLRKGATPPLF